MTIMNTVQTAGGFGVERNARLSEPAARTDACELGQLFRGRLLAGPVGRDGRGDYRGRHPLHRLVGEVAGAGGVG